MAVGIVVDKYGIISFICTKICFTGNTSGFGLTIRAIKAIGIRPNLTIKKTMFN
jgi:hypothetical protein